MAEEKKYIFGRLYNLGNDYPSDVGCRPVSGNWVASSYLDGIYTEAEAGYVSGGWNKYFNTVLPQEDWSEVDVSSRVFPDEYAIAYVQVESAYKEAVSAYPSDGIDAIEDTKYEDLSAWKGGSPYIKNVPQIGPKA